MERLYKDFECMQNYFHPYNQQHEERALLSYGMI